MTYFICSLCAHGITKPGEVCKLCKRVNVDTPSPPPSPYSPVKGGINELPPQPERAALRPPAPQPTFKSRRVPVSEQEKASPDTNWFVAQSHDAAMRLKREGNVQEGIAVDTLCVLYQMEAKGRAEDHTRAEESRRFYYMSFVIGCLTVFAAGMLIGSRLHSLLF